MLPILIDYDVGNVVVLMLIALLVVKYLQEKGYVPYL